MKTPNWVSDLVIQVLIDQKFDEIPDVTWRRANREGSSGYAGNYDTHSKRGITVNAGRGKKDQKLVLLHELAHWLNPNEGHTQKFWDKAFELYKAYKVPIRYAKTREIGYKRLAEASYRKVQGLKSKKLKRVSHIMKTMAQLSKKVGWREIIDKKKIIGMTTIYGDGRKTVKKPEYWAILRYTDEDSDRWRGFRVTEDLYNKIYL